MLRNTHPGIKPKKSLGQNFLIDENIVKKIFRELQIASDDVMLEIGPGRGELTARIAESSRHLIIVEIDGRIIEYLRQRFSSPRVTIIHGDFLETDLESFSRLYRKKLRIVGNIPYHLTSQILLKVFENTQYIRDASFMVQREVARRIISEPSTKEYGILSVYSRFYGTPKILFNVSPSCFYPKPKVTSSFMQIKLHQTHPYGIEDGIFRTVVRTAFGKRRKTLRNSLKYLPFEAKTAERIAEGIDFPLEKRPEQLSVEEFVLLARQVESFIKNSDKQSQ